MMKTIKYENYDENNNNSEILSFLFFLGRFIVSDVIQNTIFSLSTKDRTAKVIATGHMDNVEGVAVDSVGRNVYWVDATRGTVEVARLPTPRSTGRIPRYADELLDSGSSSGGADSQQKGLGARKILIDGLDKPTDIAVVPWKG
jgi:DNA-binding beta-propeller fold protein YncE